LNDHPTEATIGDAVRAADKAEDELEKRKLKKADEKNEET
jgi:hypothetical protein